MSVAETVAKVRGGIDPVGAAERAVGSLRAPVSGLIGATRGSAAIASELVGVTTGRAAIGPRSAAAMTAFVWHRPGPGVPHRLFSFAIGPGPKIPDRRDRSSWVSR